nr:hypothetical protein [Pandoraea apista]
MTHPLPNLRLQRFVNPAVEPGAPYGEARRAILGGDAFATAAREITRWPGYAETPLVALDGLARAARVAQIRYKDEAGRFGLGSFKALGGARTP